jgi:2-polyprenyl-3-methyl-5-hydroxy-6-metoxy-1,4-benzoquinol methylase
MDTDLGKRWDDFFASGFYFEGWTFRIDPTRDEQEVAGVLKLLEPTPGTHILDWCGGYGRHAIKLARLGFRVTLLDKAPNHIRLARSAAESAGVELNLICADFRETPASVQADYAVNVFTSGIGYLTEEDDIWALRSLYAALKPGALFLLDTMNLFWLVRNYQPKGWDHNDTDTKRLLEERHFDFWTNQNCSVTTLWEVNKEERRQEYRLRVYSPAELASVLRRAGFEPERLYGNFEGQPFGFDSRRIIMISRRA